MCRNKQDVNGEKAEELIFQFLCQRHQRNPSQSTPTDVIQKFTGIPEDVLVKALERITGPAADLYLEKDIVKGGYRLGVSWRERCKNQK